MFVKSTPPEILIPRGVDKQQVGGSHYSSKAIQPWDAMREWLTPDQFAGFLAGNVIKYMARWQDKDGVRDLKKARHYLDKLISEIERET